MVPLCTCPVPAQDAAQADALSAEGVRGSRSKTTEWAAGEKPESLGAQEAVRAQGETRRGQRTDWNWPQPSEPRDPGQLWYHFSIILTDGEALSSGAHSSMITEEGTVIARGTQGRERHRVALHGASWL